MIKGFQIKIILKSLRIRIIINPIAIELVSLELAFINELFVLVVQRSPALELIVIKLAFIVAAVKVVEHPITHFVALQLGPLVNPVFKHFYIFAFFLDLVEILLKNV
jgi:hypothetical protein